MSLLLRGKTYHLRRRVPRRYEAVEPRKTVWISLHTDSETIARSKAGRAWAQVIEAWEARLAGDTAGVASRLDDDAVLVHCRVLGTGGAALALVVHYAEQEQRPPRDLPVTTWKPILARNGKARVYDPRVETHDTVRSPVAPANPVERGYVRADGPYCKVFPDPGDKERLDASDTWRLFTEGLTALAALLADQPLKRWRVGSVTHRVESYN